MGERSGKLGLAGARVVFKQHMAAGKEGGDALANRFLLVHHHLRYVRHDGVEQTVEPHNVALVSRFAPNCGGISLGRHIHGAHGLGDRLDFGSRR